MQINIYNIAWFQADCPFCEAIFSSDDPGVIREDIDAHIRECHPDSISSDEIEYEVDSSIY